MHTSLSMSGFRKEMNTVNLCTPFLVPVVILVKCLLHQFSVSEENLLLSHQSFLRPASVCSNLLTGPTDYHFWVSWNWFCQDIQGSNSSCEWARCHKCQGRQVVLSLCRGPQSVIEIIRIKVLLILDTLEQRTNILQYVIRIGDIRHIPPD